MQCGGVLNLHVKLWWCIGPSTVSCGGALGACMQHGCGGAHRLYSSVEVNVAVLSHVSGTIRDVVYIFQRVFMCV